jgi:hypothetical protein
MEDQSEEGWKEAVERLQQCTVGFAKWRWGTLARCSAGILSILEDLRRAYHPRDWETSTVEGKDLVQEGLSSVAFERQLRFIAGFSGKTEHLSQWGTGCPCCGDADPKQGVSRKCVWASRRLEALRTKVEQTAGEFREMGRTLPEGDPDERHDARHACNYFAAVIDVRTKFLCTLPHYVIFVAYQWGAQRGLAMYREEEEKGIEHDRVSDYFMAPSSPLLAHVEAVAAGEPPHPDLQKAVNRYKWFPISDKYGEEGHAVYSRGVKLVTHGHHSWHCASARLPGNIELLDRIGEKAFIARWNQWKQILKKEALRKNNYDAAVYIRKNMRIATPLFLRQVSVDLCTVSRFVVWKIEIGLV